MRQTMDPTLEEIEKAQESLRKNIEEAKRLAERSDALLKWKRRETEDGKSPPDGGDTPSDRPPEDTA